MAALPLPRSCEPRTVVPATVLTSPASAGQIARTQALKWCWHAAAWRAAKTRPNVSCEGLALGKARARSSHVCLALPKGSPATQESAPQRRAHARLIRSISQWWLVRSRRGSVMVAKAASKLSQTAVSVVAPRVCKVPRRAYSVALLLANQDAIALIPPAAEFDGARIYAIIMCRMLL